MPPAGRAGLSFPEREEAGAMDPLERFSSGFFLWVLDAKEDE